MFFNQVDGARKGLLQCPEVLDFAMQNCVFFSYTFKVIAQKSTLQYLLHPLSY